MTQESDTQPENPLVGVKVVVNILEEGVLIGITRGAVDPPTSRTARCRPATAWRRLWPWCRRSWSVPSRGGKASPDSRPVRRQPRRRPGEPAGPQPAANRPLPLQRKGYSNPACSRGGKNPRGIIPPPQKWR